MRSFAIPIVITAATALAAVGCGGTGAVPAVPSITRSAHAASVTAAQGSGSAGPARAAALHAAAQCIRQHGIPGYSDPVLTPSSEVYTDTRAFQDAPQTVVDAVRQACGALLTRANLNPFNEPSAPPQLVQAGVRAAECLRAHGLPNMRDPTARSPYTPGHGFGMSASEMPAGGKASPVWQQASRACSAQLDAEIRVSTLGSLGNDG
jgi:hypothetical protein